jgi:CRP-like cAMP-binding protein
MQTHMFKFLSPNDWTLLSNKARPLTFRLGEEIIRAGSHVSYVYIIRGGSASVELPAGYLTTTVAVLREGDLCGEQAFLGDGISAASVIAKDNQVLVDAIQLSERARASGYSASRNRNSNGG